MEDQASKRNTDGGHKSQVQKICWRCGKSGAADFCEDCGAPLIRQFCVECGAAVTTPFCNACGSIVNERAAKMANPGAMRDASAPQAATVDTRTVRIPRAEQHKLERVDQLTAGNADMELVDLEDAAEDEESDSEVGGYVGPTDLEGVWRWSDEADPTRLEIEVLRGRLRGELTCVLNSVLGPEESVQIREMAISLEGEIDGDRIEFHQVGPDRTIFGTGEEGSLERLPAGVAYRSRGSRTRIAAALEQIRSVVAHLEYRDGRIYSEHHPDDYFERE